VEPSSAPWRAFETAESDPTAPARGGGSGPAAGAETAPIPRTIVLGAIALLLVLGAGAAALVAGNHDGSNVVVGAASSRDPAEGPGTVELVVDVGGAVLRPGVYHLARGSRIGDAIAAAGGYGPRVDAARASTELNLAALVEDGQQVVVPSRDGPAATSGGGSAEAGGAGALVDLNKATEAELEALPGIGPATAAKIITSRETTPFTAVQDLRDRKLVGQKTFDGLKDLVTVR